MKFSATSNLDAVYDFMNGTIYERFAAVCKSLLDSGNVQEAHLEFSNAWVVRANEGHLLARIQVAARDITPVLTAASPEGLLNLSRVAYPDGELYPASIVGQLEGAAGVVYQIKGLPRGLRPEAIPAFLSLAYERPADDFEDLQYAKSTEEVRIRMPPGATGVPESQGYVVENPYFEVPRGALKAKLLRYPQRLVMPTMTPPRPMQRHSAQAAGPIPAPLPAAVELETFALAQAEALRTSRQQQQQQQGEQSAAGGPRRWETPGNTGAEGNRERAGGEAPGSGGAGNAGGADTTAGAGPSTGPRTGGAGLGATGIRGAGAARGGPGSSAGGLGSRGVGTGAIGRGGSVGGATTHTRDAGLGEAGVGSRSVGGGITARANTGAAPHRTATGDPAPGRAPPRGEPGAAKTGNDGQPDPPAQGPQTGPEAGIGAPTSRQDTTDTESLRRPRPADPTGESPLTQRPRHGGRRTPAAPNDSWDEFDRAAAMELPQAGIRLTPGPYDVLAQDDPGDADGAGDAAGMQLGF